MAQSKSATDQASAGDTSLDESPADAFADAAGYARQIKAYALYYLSARMDAAKLTVRRAVVYTIAGLVAAVAGVTLLVMAVVLLMLGLSDLINWALHFAYAGLTPWVGPLVVGVGVLGSLILAAKVVIPRRFRAWQRQTQQEYAAKRQQQREHVEQDVHQRSRS